MLKSLRSPASRNARRLARIARWDRPIGGPADRAKAWIHMALADHGIFRLFYLNHHRLGDKVWRSAQPAPFQLARFARQGIRTIVNLRGGREHGSWQLQKEACGWLGLTLVDFTVRSRGAPDREAILGAKAFFERLDYPVLLHCKSGADRAGFMAVLYLVLQEGRPVREALCQLSVRYGHFRFAKTGILDAFFERYLAEGEPRGQPFLDWVEHDYDPVALERDFRTRFWAELLADRILRRE